jgi:hypothetical protein
MLVSIQKKIGDNIEDTDERDKSSDREKERGNERGRRNERGREERKSCCLLFRKEEIEVTTS